MVTAPKRAGIRRTISQKKGKWIPLLITGLVLIIVMSVAVFYLSDVSKADTEAIHGYNTEYIENVKTTELEEGVIAYYPNGEIKAGLVFYPGGRVEYTSYEPLLKACAEQGIACIVVEMPQNLAIFGINKGSYLNQYFPSVKDWYIGGHSLGGSMAANCASNHSDVFKGVILLGAYSTTDISNLEVLSIYGSEDHVMNKGKYNKNKENLPDNFTEQIINGGNHAYFGMYGEQKGDGSATISNVEQINTTAEIIANFILK